MQRFLRANLSQAREHWLAVLTSLIAFFLGSLLIFKNYILSDRFHYNLLIAVSLGISISIAAKISARSLKSYAFMALGGFLVVGLFFVTQWESKYFLERLIQFSLITHLWVAIAPAIQNRFTDEVKTGRFNWMLLVRINLVAIQCFVLLIGLLVALYSLEFLFGMKVKSQFYGVVWMFVGYVVSCFLLVASFEDQEEQASPKSLRLLIKNAFTPLSLLYFVILYIYAIQILITMQWPQGKVGWLVSGLSVMIILTFLIKRPFEKQERLSEWIEKFWSWSFALLIPLLILLCGAIWRRVSEYGWTEERIALAVLAIWTLGVAIYYIRPERRTLHAIPVSLLVVCLVFWIGPTSFQALAFKSQRAQFQALIGADYNPKGTKLSRKLSSQDIDRTKDLLKYFCKNHGVKKLGEVIGHYIKEDERSDMPGRLFNEDCYSFGSNSAMGRAASLINLETAPSDEVFLSKSYFEVIGDRDNLPYVQRGDVFVANVTRRNISGYDYALTSRPGFNFAWKNYESVILVWRFGSGEANEIDLKPYFEKFVELQKQKIPFSDARYQVVQEGRSGTLTLVFYSLSVSSLRDSLKVDEANFFAYFEPRRK